jgi:hypothetical protein
MPVMRALLRCGALVALLSGSIFVASACGADVSSGFQAGDGGGSDAGTEDGPSFGDSGIESTPAFVAINTTPKPFLVCVSMSPGSGAPPRFASPLPLPTELMPEGNYPAVGAYGGATLGAIGDSRDRSARVYLIDAHYVADNTKYAGKGCEELLAALRENQEFFAGDITAIQPAQHTLIEIHGCGPQASDCNGTKPPKVTLHALANGLPNEGGLNAQFVNLSSARVSAKIGPLGAGEVLGPLEPQRLTPLDLYDRPGTTAKLSSEGLTVEIPGDAGVTAFHFSYATIHGQSQPSTALDRYFTQRAKYVFAIVGDPSASVPQLFADDAGTRNPEYKGRGLHVVAFPVARVPPLQ